MIFQNKLFSVLRNSVRCQHIYKTSYCPSSELAERLCNNLIYNENGIVVFNKPYGVSFALSDPPDRKTSEPNEVSLKTMLPHIKKILGYPTLLSAKVPEKYTSGVAIFCTDENTVLKVKTALTKMRSLATPQDNYIAVVVGSPTSYQGEFKGGITLKQSLVNKKQKKGMLVTTYSKKSAKRGDVSSVIIHYHTINSSDHASLVSVSTTRNRWYCVRTFLSTNLLCPVLGDNIFGSRVKTVLGSPVLVDILSQTTLSPQKLPQEIKKRLDIVDRKDLMVPLHLHLNKTLIHNFNNKELIEFNADPPDTFKWTCERLELNLV